MTQAEQKVAEQALALPESERTEILHLLRDSLPNESETLSQEAWDEAWKKELETRIEEMESGEDPRVPLDRVLAELQKPTHKS